MLSHETRHGRETGAVICGIDEVGRGPLAGPVVAAAVILPRDLPDDFLATVRDSKALSTTQREKLFGPITRLCRFAIAEATVTEIDQINILQATMLAMRRAMDGLGIVPDIALIDGNRCPKPLPCKAEAIIKGDAHCLSIAAASIIAKVHRDKLMTQLATEYPGYGWERNAGYGTAAHMTGLKNLGVTPHHRASFAPVREMLVLPA